VVRRGVVHTHKLQFPNTCKFRFTNTTPEFAHKHFFPLHRQPMQSPTNIHLRTHAHVHTYTTANSLSHTHTNTHTQSHTHAHTHARTHTHIMKPLPTTSTTPVTLLVLTSLLPPPHLQTLHPPPTPLSHFLFLRLPSHHSRETQTVFPEVVCWFLTVPLRSARSFAATRSPVRAHICDHECEYGSIFMRILAPIDVCMHICACMYICIHKNFLTRIHTRTNTSWQVCP